MQNQPPRAPAIPSVPANYIVNPVKIKEIVKQEMHKVIPQSRGGSWNSLQFRPRATFAGQNKGEVIFLLVRRHWITNVNWIIRNIFYCFVPLIIFLVIDFLNLDVTFFSWRLYVLAAVAYYSLIVTNVVRDFFDWYFDVYIVTNERLLEYQFKPFANYSIEEIFIENIEGVKQKTPGFIASVFNYGNVTVQTEAKDKEIRINYVSNPAKIRDIISDMVRISRNLRGRND